MPCLKSLVDARSNCRIWQTSISSAPVASCPNVGITVQSGIELAVDDVLTLVNDSSAAAVTLPSVAGGKQANVNAAVNIQKIY